MNLLASTRSERDASQSGSGRAQWSVGSIDGDGIRYGFTTQVFTARTIRTAPTIVRTQSTRTRLLCERFGKSLSIGPRTTPPPARASADEERQARTAEARRIPEPVIRPFEVHAVLAQETVHDLDLFPEARNPLARGREVEPVRLVLALHPAGSDPERHAPVRDLVRRRRGAGEHGGMTEGAGRDERAELELGGPGREPRDRRPGVQDRPVLVGERDVVVGAEQRFDAVLLAGRRERDRVLPGHTLLAFDHEGQAHEAEAYSGLRGPCPWTNRHGFVTTRVRS